MNLIYVQQSGKPVAGTAGQFWSMAAVAVPATKWKTLQSRVNGLQKSFQRRNFRPGFTRIDANDLLHMKNAERAWSLAFTKGLERIVASLGLKFFLVVVDKTTTDKPAHPKWLLPLAYHYLNRHFAVYLREQNSLGSIVIPVGREDERTVLTELQLGTVSAASNKAGSLIGTPMMQTEHESAGLQVADFVATVGRRYHEHVYPKLFAKQILEGYDAIINSHYQGFVKPNTFQAATMDERGFRMRGYIYLWRKDSQRGDEHGTTTGLQMASMGQDSPHQPPSGFGGSPAAGSATAGAIRPRVFYGEPVTEDNRGNLMPQVASEDSPPFPRRRPYRPGG